ncbi:TPM domain-containing protein [Tenacibaculum amylolyticum]|uniref:TPM domain-containing protein n=1 Tax=Tenacibaculum amylolyticum TaxID=104269 RepID=UPI0038B51A40
MKNLEKSIKGQIINDYDRIFTPLQVEDLSKIINNYYNVTTRQIVIVTVDTISPYKDIQRMAADLGQYWGVGMTEKNNGLIILLCKPCRKITIVTGNGTELILTNQVCKEIIDKIMVPEFKDGDFYKGIKKGIFELISKWE